MVLENKQFQREFLCYSMNFLEIQDNTKNANHLNCSDKIIMPEATLDHLHRYHEIQCPYTFQLKNSTNSKTAYCGVLEFTSENPHVIYAPNWLMFNLGIKDGDRIYVNSVTLDKGQSIILRPPNNRCVMSISIRRSHFAQA